MKKMKRSELAEKFRKELIERKKMNYLLGGDGDGGEGGTYDPWD
jgi:hypothetical protein